MGKIVPYFRNDHYLECIAWTTGWVIRTFSIVEDFQAIAKSSLQWLQLGGEAPTIKANRTCVHKSKKFVGF